MTLISACLVVHSVVDRFPKVIAIMARPRHDSYFEVALPKMSNGTIQREKRGRLTMEEKMRLHKWLSLGTEKLNRKAAEGVLKVSCLKFCPRFLECSVPGELLSSLGLVWQGKPVSPGNFVQCCRRFLSGLSLRYIYHPPGE